MSRSDHEDGSFLGDDAGGNDNASNARENDDHAFQGQEHDTNDGEPPSPALLSAAARVADDLAENLIPSDDDDVEELENRGSAANAEETGAEQSVEGDAQAQFTADPELAREQTLPKELTFASDGKSTALPANLVEDEEPDELHHQPLAVGGNGEAQMSEIPAAPPLPPPHSGGTLTQSESVTSEGVNFETNALSVMNLSWCFGLNSLVVPSINLSNEFQKVIMYTCAHVAVLYDFENNRQRLLQAHTNNIIATCCSADKRWVVTSCSGPSNTMVVWDTWQGVALRTYCQPHKLGIFKVAITADTKYILGISVKPTKGSEQQTFFIWNWLSDDNAPIACLQLNSSSWGRINHIYVNPADSRQIILTGNTQCVFIEWELGTDKLLVFAPPLTYDTFNKHVGRFQQSIIVPGSSMALSATNHGTLVVWEEHRILNQPPSSVMEKRPTKLLELQPHVKFTVLTHIDKYIVTADEKGHVKFFGTNLQLVFWYSDLNLDPINSVSFHHLTGFDTERPPQGKSRYPQSALVDRRPFVCRPFTVGTRAAVQAFVDPNGPRLHLIHRDHDYSVTAIAVHPLKPLIAIGGSSGLIKVWDYESRVTLCSRYMKKTDNISCIAFDPAGNLLGLGMTDGRVKLLDYPSLWGVAEVDKSVPEVIEQKPLDAHLETDADKKDDKRDLFHYTDFAISKMVFSHDSIFMATSDEGCTTTIYVNVDQRWQYLGRFRAHYRCIVDIMFGIEADTNRPRLLTLGDDRMLVEYDLFGSTQDKIRILSRDRIEQSAKPICMSWYPPITKETFIVCANDQYKYKLYNATTKMCRKTFVGPTLGSPVRKLLILPQGQRQSDGSSTSQVQRDRSSVVDALDQSARYLAFITKTHVGLCALPLDGNCFRSLASIAHPGSVTNLCSSHDGQYVFTCGGRDQTCSMWKVNPAALDGNTRLGGGGLEAFYSMVEGGREGTIFKQMETFFYYSMMRSQSVDTMDTRKVSKTIELSEIPYAMRALGVFPSEQEIENMLNEVKFSEYVESGEQKEQIDINDFLKLYINHRPAFGFNMAELRHSFKFLCANEGVDSGLDRSILLDVLQAEGEHMTEYELAEYLSILLGKTEEGASSEKRPINTDAVADLLDEHIPFHMDLQFTMSKLLGLPCDSADLDSPATRVSASTTRSMSVLSRNTLFD